MFASLFSRSSQSKANRSQPKVGFKPELEMLEDRTVPSTFSGGAAIVVPNAGAMAGHGLIRQLNQPVQANLAAPTLAASLAASAGATQANLDWSTGNAAVENAKTAASLPGDSVFNGNLTQQQAAISAAFADHQFLAQSALPGYEVLMGQSPQINPNAGTNWKDPFSSTPYDSNPGEVTNAFIQSINQNLSAMATEYSNFQGQLMMLVGQTRTSGGLNGSVFQNELSSIEGTIGQMEQSADALAYLADQPTQFYTVSPTAVSAISTLQNDLQTLDRVVQAANRNGPDAFAGEYESQIQPALTAIQIQFGDDVNGAMNSVIQSINS